jgi:class 3 adenylate cyclase
MSLLAAVLITTLVWAVLFVAFLVAVRRRWLARFHRGFFIQIGIALLGVALMATSVVGVWGYFAARQVLDDDLEIQMQDIGKLVEGQVAHDLDRIERQMSSLGKSLAAARAKGASTAELKGFLAAAQSFETNYVQMRFIDGDGTILAETRTVQSSGEPMNRIGIAYNQEGKPFVSDAYYSDTFKREILLVSLPITDENGKVTSMIMSRFDLAAEFAELIKDATFNQSGFATLVDGDGQIIAHPDSSRLEEDVSDWPAVQAARQSNDTGALVAKNKAGQNRLYVYRAIRNPSTVGNNKPWVLLTEVDRDEELAGLRRLRRELGFGVMLVLICGLLIAHQVSTSVTEPLERLGDFAKRIGSGDLTTRTSIAGRDVSGRLSERLNDMANGLQERDHVKEVFGRYIATQVSDKILKGEVNLGGESKRVTILFSDIRNFTGMSESMAPQQVVSFLNDYFSEMVDAVFEHGGVLDKFMGDGLMAVFGSLEDTEHEMGAVKAALRMRALLAKINGVRAVSGIPPIAIGIGIHTDACIVGNIGSRKRLEYTVVGDGVNTSSRLQALNKEYGTTILISETTYEKIKDHFDCRQMPDAQLRGKTKNLHFYEVLNIKVVAAPVPEYV